MCLLDSFYVFLGVLFALHMDSLLTIDMCRKPILQIFAYSHEIEQILVGTIVSRGVNTYY